MVTRTRILEEAWTADQIMHHPESVVGAAVRSVAGGGEVYRPAISLSTLPVLGNNRRRWQTSVYQVSNIIETVDGLKQYAVVIRADMHQVICQRDRSTAGWSKWREVIDLRTIAGDPFGEQVDDSHNTFSLALDPDGNLHVWGNMHTNAMRYARTTSPGNLSTLTGFSPWSANANGVTYPTPFTDTDGDLYCGWRNGYATSGDYFVSRWTGAETGWTPALRVLNGTTSNEGAYPHNPAVRNGKIGFFYMWRGSGDASTNTDFGYIESLDGGSTWQDIDGNVLALPITHATAPVIIDAPVGSGLINQGGADIDAAGHPHAGVQMYDADGNTQLFHVYHDGESWHVDQVTNWSHRIETVGQTTLLLDVARVQAVCAPNGRTYFITRTRNEGFNGAPIMLDVTPGGDPTPFKLADINLDGWEPAYDTAGLRRDGMLRMLITPIAPVADSRTNWDAQWLGVLEVDMVQIGSIQAGKTRIPTIRTIRTFDRGLEARNVGSVVEAPVSREVLPTGYVDTRDFGKADVLFTRLLVFAGFESGTTSATLLIRAQPNAGLLPTEDVSSVRMVNSSLAGLRATPWEPLAKSPYVEMDGSRRATWLVPRLVTSDAAGISIRTFSLEVGILDWV